MKYLLRSCIALMGIVLLAGTAAAADTISAGKIKSVNADQKGFVLTDAADKEWTFKLGDKVVINRGLKEGKDPLKAGDSVKILHDKSLFTWTASYVLVQEGDSKNCELLRGAVKRYDADKKQVTITDGAGMERTFAMGDAPVRLNKQDTKIADIKIGDSVLLIVEEIGDKATLKCLMADRK